MAIFFLIVGCCIGSFLNVLIDRIPRHESPFHGRSHCDSCKHTLAWYDLIPFVSFLLLQGKCRYCHKKIGLQALWLELLTGFLFLFTGNFVLHMPLSPLLLLITMLYIWYIFSSFVVISFIDIKHGIIPNTIVYPAFVISLVYHMFFLSTSLPFFISCVGAGSFFFFLFLITRGRGMGFGDVKLAFVLGLFLGFPNIIVALYIAFLTGALVAFILVLGKKKKFSGGTIPFGPFLIIGSVLAFFFGNTVWSHFILRLF